MDFMLRCNSLKCRTQLTEKAVVTTCSHIFCITCSENLGLAAASGSHRTCPACRAPLVNPDDVVATTLNPSEDYKTSVLSGLSPAIIIECASRGMNFWSYQSTQEIVYQEYLAKTLTDKYSNLNVQMDKLVNDANAEIDGLNQRLSQLQLDQEKLKQDNQTLLNALREKNRKHAQTQDLYDRLRRKEMTAATQHAAFDSVDDVLSGATAVAVPGSHMRGVQNGHHMMPPPPPPAPSVYAQRSISNPGVHGEIHMPTNIPQVSTGQNPFASRFSPNMAGSVVPSSSLHRARLGPGNSSLHGQNNGPQLSSALHRANHLHTAIGNTPLARRTLGHGVGTASVLRHGAGHAGYGLSAGMRAGSVQGGDNAGAPWLH